MPYSILSSHPELTPILFSALTVTGIFLIAIGIYVYLQCVWDFAFGGEGDNPTVVVARGTYKFVRNPMYASLVLILFIVILYEKQALAN